MRRILGVDVGSVRVGLAISDPLGITAQPLEVIDRRRVDPFVRICDIVRELEVERIVLGQPLRLAGEAGQAVATVDAFAGKLEERLQVLGLEVNIERWDERLTTRMAERAMIEGGARRKARKENIDKVAAAVLLQSYLDARTKQ